jgi:hypothetical protein|tara:strand:- start:1021 stop:1380 length:360 start_codon:yes stop_codon:yes gene_type:complete
MATKPINRFTVAESNNLQVYENYSSEQINCNDANAHEGTSWGTGSDGPAKSIIIVPYTGTGSGEQITINLKVNGSYGDNIIVEFDNLPLTIDNLLIDRVKITSAGGGSTAEVFTLLSFH